MTAPTPRRRPTNWRISSFAACVWFGRPGLPHRHRLCPGRLTT